jgi:zinc transport system ATP-binding protein
MPQLSCQNLSLSYEGKTVVSGLRFELNAGDCLCIVGENGSGKTTLMKAILRLKTPAQGQILLGDGLNPNDVGYLPQQTESHEDFPASVWEVVLSGCLNRRGMRPYYSRAEKRAARENMERLGISALGHSCFRELSGGQQQRALLARALCAAGKILLLDEPAAGLDAGAAEDFYGLVKELSGRGLTIVMISHDLASCLKYASHILHIGKETQLFFGTARDYQQSGLTKGQGKGGQI